MSFLTPEAVNSARSKYGAATVILLVGLFSAYLAAQFVLTDDWNLLGVFLISIIGAVVAVRILNTWRHGRYILYCCQGICGGHLHGKVCGIFKG